MLIFKVFCAFDRYFWLFFQEISLDSKGPCKGSLIISKFFTPFPTLHLVIICLEPPRALSFLKKWKTLSLNEPTLDTNFRSHICSNVHIFYTKHNKITCTLLVLLHTNSRWSAWKETDNRLNRKKLCNIKLKIKLSKLCASMVKLQMRLKVYKMERWAWCFLVNFASSISGKSTHVITA